MTLRGLRRLVPIVAVMLSTACADSDGPGYVVPETIVREFARSTGGGCDVDVCGQRTGWDVGESASTRLAWIEKDVPAEGRVHEVSFTLLPRDGDGYEQHGATALRGVVTVERL
jgi:hypothetical protein